MELTKWTEAEKADQVEKWRRLNESSKHERRSWENERGKHGEEKKMTQFAIELINSYSEAFKKSWNEILGISTHHRFKVAGFPGGVIMLFEGSSNAESNDIIDNNYPDIRAAWNAVKGDSKIVEEDLRHSFATAANGMWNSDVTHGYISGDGICIVKGIAPSFFANDEAYRDAKTAAELGIAQTKKSLNLRKG